MWGNQLWHGSKWGVLWAIINGYTRKGVVQVNQKFGFLAPRDYMGATLCLADSQSARYVLFMPCPSFDLTDWQTLADSLPLSFCSFNYLIFTFLSRNLASPDRLFCRQFRLLVASNLQQQHLWSQTFTWMIFTCVGSWAGNITALPKPLACTVHN